MSRTSRLDKRGVRPIVTRRGARDAMDARVIRRVAQARTAKACGPGAPVAGANPRVEEPGGTVTQKPVSPGRARYRPLTPSRRECRCFGFICGDYTRVLISLHTGLRVQPNTRHSLRPLFSFGVTTSHHSGAIRAAG